jgi:hypothetical protein
MLPWSSGCWRKTRRRRASDPMLIVSMREKAKRLQERKCALGIDDVRLAAARNQGASRTPAKRALLQTLSNEARRQGRELPFAANF